MRQNILFILFTLTVTVTRAQPAVYKAPSSIKLSGNFLIDVKTKGKTWKNVPCYPAKIARYEGLKAKADTTSFAYFDISDSAEVSVRYMLGPIKQVRIRPASLGIKYRIVNDRILFSLNGPRKISVEINGDIYHNLQLFAGNIQSPPIKKTGMNNIYFGPGIHYVGEVHLASNQKVYVAGGAVVKGSFLIFDAKNVSITGRGIITQMDDFEHYNEIKNPEEKLKGTAEMIRIGRSQQITIEGVTLLPKKYSLVIGGSKNVSVKDVRSFSQESWGDGIDIFGSSDIEIDNLYLRNSDDCIAVYASRKEFTGNSKNISVKNSILWADVAHPILIGTHGNTPIPEEISNIRFKNIDILNHSENQIDYQGCMALNAGDGNSLRDIEFDDIRVEEIANGQLFNIRVMNNTKYNTSPGLCIEKIRFKNINYKGKEPNLSIISGYNEKRVVRDIVFENLHMNGKVIFDNMPGKPSYYKTSDIAKFYIGEHVQNVSFIKTE